MAPHVVKTLLRADGKRRVVIIQREEGLFGFREEQFIASPAGERGVDWRRIPRFVTPLRLLNARQERRCLGFTLHDNRRTTKIVFKFEF